MNPKHWDGSPDATQDPTLFSKMFLEAFQHIKWMAQTVHQAYHLEEGDSYRTCTRDICASTQALVWKWAKENVEDFRSKEPTP